MIINGIASPGLVGSAALALVVFVSSALAESPQPLRLAFDGPSQEETWDEGKFVEEPKPAAEKAPGWEKPLPLSLTLEYTLVSDYVFRGINYSEYPREGRERPNHQLGTSLSLDLAPLWGKPAGEYGEIGFDTWFEWFAGQKELNPTTGENIQEIDYTIWYSYKIKQIATDVKVGWLDYVYPNLVGVKNDERTNEWSFSLAHNDAWVFRSLGYQGEDGILNPTLSFYQDLHTSGGCWADFSISHPFGIIKNLTLTPSYMLHIDFGWAGPYAETSTGSDDHDTRIAGMTYGLDLTYDLTEVLRLPAWAGTLAISGFINWFDPTPQYRHYGPILGVQDELYGGTKLTWSW
jgi:hypothetical protein